MSNQIPLSADGKPFRYRFNPFSGDYLDFTANHPDASPADRELGPLGLVVLPELTRLLVEIRSVYRDVTVQNRGCFMLCLAGLALIFEHIILLMGETLLDRSVDKGSLEDLINELAKAGYLSASERDELHVLRKLRNHAVHRQFKHTLMDPKATFLDMHAKLMSFLQKRFITGGSVKSGLSFLEFHKGAYYVKPSFEDDKFVQKFWLQRCVPAGTPLK